MTPWIIDMWWRDVLFAHWPATAELATRLPRGLALDLFDGVPWISVVPFRMTDVHARFAPVLPGFARVSEINLRTYVTCGGRRGIYFFSLDADEPLVVRSARIATGLPYFDARIATSERDGEISYRSERTHRGVVAGRFHARYHAEGDTIAAEPGTIEAFLHERYSFFSARRGRLYRADVLHEPWWVRHAEIEIAENGLGAIAGQDAGLRPALCFFARGLRVRATAALPFGSG